MWLQENLEVIYYKFEAKHNPEMNLLRPGAGYHHHPVVTEHKLYHHFILNK